MRGGALIAIALVVLGAVPALGGHGGTVLDVRRPTPGVQLELLAHPEGARGDPGRPAYRLRATAVPPGVVLGVWVKPFGEPFRQVAGGFVTDGAGVLLGPDRRGGSRRLDEMRLEPGPYVRGAAWEVALASADESVQAFAKVIPKPLDARDGPCTLQLELASRLGDRFVASGSGFAPGEEVAVESRVGGHTTRSRHRVDASGLFGPELILTGAAGSDHGARYAVKGRSCQPVVEYQSGEPALRRH